MVAASVHSSAIKLKMEHQREIDLSTFHQPILQSTTVTSENCASIHTIGVKILCVFLQVIVLEGILHSK